MNRQEVVAKLRNLREEIERDGEVRIASLETTFALALSDVCNALGLTEEEHVAVLGQDAAACVAEILQVRCWPVEREVAGKTAPITQAEEITVPV